MGIITDLSMVVKSILFRSAFYVIWERSISCASFQCIWVNPNRIIFCHPFFTTIATNFYLLFVRITNRNKSNVFHNGRVKSNNFCQVDTPILAGEPNQWMNGFFPNVNGIERHILVRWKNLAPCAVVLGNPETPGL